MSYPVRGLKCTVTLDNIVVRVIVVVKRATNSNIFSGKKPDRRQFSQALQKKKVLVNLHAPPSFLSLNLQHSLLNE